MITFDGIETEKCHNRENIIFLKDIDIDSLLISTMVSFGEKNYK